MQKSKKSRKPSKSDLGATLKFRNTTDALKYKPVSLEDVTQDIVENERVKPNRATIENVLQNQYRYNSPLGDSVKLLTGTKDGKINKKGSSWVHIVNGKDERLWTREFYRTDIKGLTERLLPYALLAKNITDNRPPGMDLIEIKETKYQWQTINGKVTLPFNLNDYLYVLTDEEKAFVIRNEKKRDAYLIKTAGKVTRQRELQKTWNEAKK